MRLLIITQYYPPEIGPPQNRLSELALRLKDSGHDVEILTAMPNYPHMQVHEAYKGKYWMTEEVRGIKVHRAWIYASTDRGLFRRMINYCSFTFTSFFRGLFIKGKWDYMMCESPPLFLGFTAVLLSRIRGAKLIFNVADLWPESAESLGIVTNKRVLKWSYNLEAWIYRKSYLITGQTKGIINDIRSRFPSFKLFWLPNGVDTAVFDPSIVTPTWRERMQFEDGQFLLFYGGILGYAQGLEVVLKAAKKLEDTRACFVLLGEGPKKEFLMEMAEELNLKNVRFLPAVSREEMPEIVASADALVSPLRGIELFKGALPTKVFENLAMEKPVFLGVRGEAYDLFIKEAKAGWYFEPENEVELANVVREALENPDLIKQYGQNGRRFVVENFDRKRIVERFEHHLKTLEK